MRNAIDLAQYSEDELVALNVQILERLRSLRQNRRFRAMTQFNLGDVVSFSPEPGRIILGKIIRANTKTITVLTSSGERWRVSPELLAHTTEAETNAGSGRAEVIELPLSRR